MKYTKNYHLPQWVETDRIMMRDFNQMCANIENGLSKNAASNTYKSTHIAAFTAPFCAVIHDLSFHLSSSVSELRADYPCRAKIFDVT